MLEIINSKIQNAKFRIREIAQDDWYNVCALLSNSISPFMPNQSDFEDIWTSFFMQKNVYAVVCENSKNDVVGYASIMVQTKIRGGRQGHIEDVVVNKTYRNQGIGTFLIKNLIDYAHQKRCYRIILETNDENKRFYFNLGFEYAGSALKFTD